MKVGPWGCFIGCGPISFPGTRFWMGDRSDWAGVGQDICLPAGAPPAEVHSASLDAVALRSATG